MLICRECGEDHTERYSVDWYVGYDTGRTQRRIVPEVVGPCPTHVARIRQLRDELAAVPVLKTAAQELPQQVVIELHRDWWWRRAAHAVTRVAARLSRRVPTQQAA